MNIVSMIFVMVLATFLVRAFSLVLFSGRTFPPLFMRTISIVPVAILCAICGPLIFRPEQTLTNPFLLIEFWSSIACIAFARFGTVPAICIGMCTYLVGKLYWV